MSFYTTARTLYMDVMADRHKPASVRKREFIERGQATGLSEWLVQMYFHKIAQSDPIWNEDWHKELRFERLNRLEIALRVCNRVRNHPTPSTEFDRLLKAQGWGSFSIQQAKKRCWKRLPRHLQR